MSGLDNDMELPQPPEPYKAMTEQPDWAVRAAEALSVTGLLARYDECQCDSPEEVEAKAAAIIRANSPDVGKLREALEFYANPLDWEQGIASGRFCGAEDGEPFMAFSKGEDHPWSVAKSALASVPQPTPAFTSDEDGTALAYAAESIPAETLTDEFATALDGCLSCLPYIHESNDAIEAAKAAAHKILARYKAMKGKQ